MNITKQRKNKLTEKYRGKKKTPYACLAEGGGRKPSLTSHFHLSFFLLLTHQVWVLSLNPTSQQPPQHTHATQTPCPDQAGVVPRASSAVLPDLFRASHFRVLVSFRLKHECGGNCTSGFPERWVDGANVLQGNTSDTYHP